MTAMAAKVDDVVHPFGHTGQRIPVRANMGLALELVVLHAIERHLHDVRHYHPS